MRTFIRKQSLGGRIIPKILSNAAPGRQLHFKNVQDRMRKEREPGVDLNRRQLIGRVPTGDTITYIQHRFGAQKELRWPGGLDLLPGWRARAFLS